MKKVRIINGEFKGIVGDLTGMFWGAGVCTVCFDGAEHSFIIKDVEPYTETTFAKSNLKTGMIIEYNDGDKGMIVGNTIMGKDEYVELEDIEENLEHSVNDDCTIKRVYKTTAKTLNDAFLDRFLKLIWEREEEPAYFNGNVVCSSLNGFSETTQYTVGKIYKIEDGILIDDNNCPSLMKIKSMIDLNDRSYAIWMETKK